ncbi:hypothetical protein CYMTET_40321 [Cymbomonas tetramitiformis]|uniref:Uncharacterized protein n=1 Tax=Cymbomonas tetramitiformis TaxID=36881 RepID=A0AAE0C883_9CHLO|nr:hypothetical protein CYMTET_40321 [Cymbomonas tetramitiformis]
MANSPYAISPLFGGTSVGPPAPASELRNQFSGTIFSGYDAGPSLPNSTQFPENMQPTVYAREAQQGMFWAQETIPHMYLHKIPNNAAHSTLAKVLFQDIQTNVRGNQNSNTPNWPLFVLTDIQNRDILKRDLMKYQNVTSVFCTWQTLVDHGQLGSLKFNFAGVLKNVPTGAVGSDCVALNLIVGGRVSLPNYWGCDVYPGMGLYFLLLKDEGGKLSLVPYCDPNTNLRPKVGDKELSIERQKMNDYKNERLKTHEVLKVYRVGVSLDAGAPALGHLRPYKHDAENNTIIFGHHVKEKLCNNNNRINDLGKIEIYLGV